MRKLVVSLLVASLVALGCGSSGEGESCSTEGQVGGGCDDGLVCGKKTDSNADLVCLKICNSQVDCPSGLQCNGVGGTSFKGCRGVK